MKLWSKSLYKSLGRKKFGRDAVEKKKSVVLCGENEELEMAKEVTAALNDEPKSMKRR